jgi:hypothetical protein
VRHFYGRCRVNDVLAASKPSCKTGKRRMPKHPPPAFTSAASQVTRPWKLLISALRSCCRFAAVCQPDTISTGFDFVRPQRLKSDDIIIFRVHDGKRCVEQR